MQNLKFVFFFAPDAVFFSLKQYRVQGNCTDRFTSPTQRWDTICNIGGHNWDSWRPLLDNSLRAFAGLRAGDEIK